MIDKHLSQSYASEPASAKNDDEGKDGDQNNLNNIFVAPEKEQTNDQNYVLD